VAVAKSNEEKAAPSAQAEPAPVGLALASLVLPESDPGRTTIPQITAPTLPASALQPNLSFCRLGAWC
jgi:hypothetical protein